MDTNGKNDSYNIYENRWDYKKNILKREKNMHVSVKKLIVLFQKNRVLIRERSWIAAGLHDLSKPAVCHDSSVLRIREEPLSITWELKPKWFEDQACLAMLEPRVRFHIPHMFFFFWFQSICQFWRRPLKMPQHAVPWKEMLSLWCYILLA